jgi:hypothetical protein
MVRYAFLFGLLWAVPLCGCSATDHNEPGPMGPQLETCSASFFEQLVASGVPGQSYFALFLPEGTVNPRHLLRFRDGLEAALRKGSAPMGLQYNGSADRVFFLSRHKAPGWETPEGADQAGEVLASEFLKGTRAGWTAIHAFWGQYNRLLIGDSAWIQNLPESVRADLSHPLAYLVRVEVDLESQPNMTTFVHRLHLSLVEVGKEKSRFSATFPLVLTHSLL